MEEVRDRAKEYFKQVHRKVWIAWNGEIPKDHVIHHKNGKKRDNRIENLECLTIKEHGRKHRIINRRELHPLTG